MTDHLETGDSVLFLLIPADDEPILFVHEMNYEQAAEEAKGCQIEPLRKTEKITEKILKAINQHKLRRISFDEMPASTYRILASKQDGITLEPRNEVLWEMRRIKDEHEFGLLRKAAELTSIAAHTALSTARAGMTETEIAAEAEFAMRKNGSSGVAFDTIVASGPRSAWPHGLSSERRLQDGDVVVFDLGAVFKGYRSDITRTKIIGKPSGQQEKVYRLVLKAHNEARKKIRAGVKCSEVDSIARRIIARNGYKKYFTHGLGHGVGIDIHEPPRLNATNTEELVNRNVVTVEPGIYLPGRFGIRIEDTVIVRNGEPEVLTRCEKLEY